MFDSFSRRHGFAGNDVVIAVRQDAPEGMRFAAVQRARDAGLTPRPLRELICRVILVPPDQSNWSEYPNVWDEVQRLIHDCAWYYVYDIIEQIVTALGQNGAAYAEEINRYFREHGIGWQIEGGHVVIRGPEAFEAAVHTATLALQAANRQTASNEIGEARRDLSRRPDPDITGAIQHALASLECVARDVTGNPKDTLGTILKRNPNLIPPPLDGALDQLWGFASEYGRHLREGRVPAYEEAELAVSVAASIATYLTRRFA